MSDENCQWCEAHEKDVTSDEQEIVEKNKQ